MEEENNDCEKCGLVRNSTRCLFMDDCPLNKQKNIIEIPNGYQFTDENGNVIPTTKIVLEKKKPKYQTTYTECCEILKCEPWFEMNTCYHGPKLCALYRLLLCRDA